MLWFKNLVNREYAILKNDDGKSITKVRFNLQDSTFEWNRRTFNIIRDEKYREFSRGILLTKKYTYFYNMNNSNPLSFSKTSNAFEPVLDNRLYNSMLKAEILIKLNTTKSGLLGLIQNADAKTIIVFLMAIAIGIYFLTGGSLK